MAYVMDAGTASSGDLSINEMTTGMSVAGMEQYLENIKAEVLTSVTNQLDTARDEIIKSLKTAWVGQSEERFETLLTDAVEDVKTELNAEYNALASRISELENNYFNQENALISE
ncbi:MAG TPA: hypothetical protein IAC85_01780 [Candidatus Faecenecus gallistercoris]|uniref:Uncharacterized protein n=1 Tax=Candidatus Faecenecus gallistercoris TaxID=2840793 RepID=A0A9D1CJQ7_9FIRM|nr:hypothetical protein [Candidatus Faecenecus gallistercoris]